mmetsp:Transcript_21780/g.61870  ORF Transcript_21780/g.61870 Transcript_21780/m.61870 type:complete len:319 (+) Transcript_21780:159-1115(+)
MASNLAAWIALLCLSQIAMFILTKQAAQKASLPLFICFMQFAISATLTALISALPPAGTSGRQRLSSLDRSLWILLVPLGLVWMLGFVLLTASVAWMSAALAGVVRSMEPLANVALGFAAGERYSWKVMAALLPVCAGVVLASHGGGNATAGGVFLALLSNFAFSARPFLAKRLKGNELGKKLDDLEVFLAVTGLGAAALPPAVALLEGAALVEAAGRLWAAGDCARFAADVSLSGAAFFLYQFAQLRVMSQLAPLSFSVLTPVSKASMIVACALYFGDPFGASNAVGVAVSTAGVLLFASVKRAHAQEATLTEKKKS